LAGRKASSSRVSAKGCRLPEPTCSATPRSSFGWTAVVSLAADESASAVVGVDACAAAARGATASAAAATSPTIAIFFLTLIIVIACLLPSSLHGLRAGKRR
jgi:hypothetical protein